METSVEAVKMNLPERRAWERLRKKYPKGMLVLERRPDGDLRVYLTTPHVVGFMPLKV